MGLPSKQQSNPPSLPEREKHREWIGGRAFTLLSHYWRDDDSVELTAAIGRDWADVLEGLPQNVIQQACIMYQRDEPRRKPTPGAIYQIAKAMMPKPKPVDPTPAEEPQRDPPMTAQRHAEVCRELGLRVDQNGRVLSLGVRRMEQAHD